MARDPHRATDAAFVIQQLDCRNIVHLSVPGDNSPNVMHFIKAGSKAISMIEFPVMMLLFFTVSYGSVPQKAPEPTPYIRQVDFRNFTYRLEWDKEKEIIQLRDGGWIRADGAEFGLQRITYGDLTSDRSEEAIILLRCQKTRTSRTLDEVFIYTLKGGKIIALAHFEGGRRGDYILSVESLNSNFRVQDRLLILDQAILREGEYVPTQYYTIKYRWNGIQMVEVERTCLKPIPEGMREMS